MKISIQFLLLCSMSVLEFSVSGKRSIILILDVIINAGIGIVTSLFTSNSPSGNVAWFVLILSLITFAIRILFDFKTTSVEEQMFAKHIYMQKLILDKMIDSVKNKGGTFNLFDD